MWKIIKYTQHLNSNAIEKISFDSQTTQFLYSQVQAWIFGTAAAWKLLTYFRSSAFEMLLHQILRISHLYVVLVEPLQNSFIF